MKHVQFAAWWLYGFGLAHATVPWLYFSPDDVRHARSCLCITLVAVALAVTCNVVYELVVKP